MTGDAAEPVRKRRAWWLCGWVAMAAALAWLAHASVPTRAQHLAAIEARMAAGHPLRHGVDSLFRQNGVQVMYDAPLGLYSHACAKDCFVVSVGAFGHVYVF